VTVQDLEDSFTPPFKSCVEEGRASGLMCSYNRINGVPACASYPFLTQTVRNTWGFDGYDDDALCSSKTLIHLPPTKQMDHHSEECSAIVVARICAYMCVS